MPKPPDTEDEALLASIREMDREAQGIWCLQIVMLPDLAQLRAAARSGDEDARHRLILVDLARRLPPGAVCLVCPHKFDPEEVPGAVVLLTANHPEARLGITNALCRPCSRSADRLERVSGVYRQRLFHDMRMLSVGELPEAGHA
jgi:hypothetical protein